MKKILAILAAVTFSAGVAYAGCGKKVTDEGTLSKYDADTKTIVVDLGDGKTAEITATPSTESKGASGDKVEIADLIGKKVKVVSEHKKADSVEEVS